MSKFTDNADRMKRLGFGPDKVGSTEYAKGDILEWLSKARKRTIKRERVLANLWLKAASLRRDDAH